MELKLILNFWIFFVDPTQPYQSIMWVLIVAMSVILIAFILSMASMRSKRQPV